MRLLFAACFAIGLTSCAGTPPEATPDEKMRALAAHLATVDAPAGWTLTRYEIRNHSGFIQARLDAYARLDALKWAPQERMSYFSLPCPMPDSPTWRAFAPEGEVFIAVDIDGRQQFTVPCRS